MEPEKTITTEGSSPVAPTTQPDPVMFIDDPDTEDIPVVTEPAEGETDDDRFDKNPKFQERIKSLKDREKKADDLINNMNQMVAKAIQESGKRYEAQIAELTKRLEGINQKPEELDFWDAAKLDRDTFTQRWEEDPLGVYGNMARQLRHELKKAHQPIDESALAQKITNQVISTLMRESQTASVKTGVQQFAEKNPDFVEKRQEVLDYMRKHPWHNEISAYYEMKQADRDKEIEEAVEKRLKEKTSEAMKSGKTATPLKSGSRPPAQRTDIPDDVINPNKHGTTSTSAIAKMIRNMRKNGGK